MEELNQEIVQDISLDSIQPIEPSLEALREGKITFKDVPKEKRHEIRMQARETLPDDEAREAFDMGWSPKEFFLGKRADGSPKEFVDYKEFLQKINETAPVKNERLRTLTKENQDLNRQLEEIRAETRKMFEMNKIREEREIENQEARLKAEIEEAEELGDIKAFKDKTLKLNRLEQDKQKFKSFEVEETQPQQFDIERLSPEQQKIVENVQKWTAKNTWYFSSPEIQNFCNARNEEIIKDNPYISLDERLEMVKNMAAVRFPGIIPTQSKQTVLSSKTTGLNATPKTTMSFDQLPEAERKTGEWMLKAGVYKTKAEIVQAYLKREQEKRGK